jgi:hypothetical protein
MLFTIPDLREMSVGESVRRPQYWTNYIDISAGYLISSYRTFGAGFTQLELGSLPFIPADMFILTRLRKFLTENIPFRLQNRDNIINKRYEKCKAGIHAFTKSKGN